MNTLTINKTKNFVDSKNELNTFANKKIPLLLKRLNEGFKIMASGVDFYAKDAKNLREILNHDSKKLTCYINITAYTIVLNVKCWYKVDKYSVSYIDKAFYLWSITTNKSYDFEEKALLTLEEANEKLKRITELKEQISTLDSEISKLKYDLSPLA
jgi:hypothetical protein